MKKSAIFLLLSCLALSRASHAADLYVPSEFGTIQQAVDAAADGDRILVEPLTFTESVTVSGKSVTIQTDPFVNEIYATIKSPSSTRRALIATGSIDVRCHNLRLTGGLLAVGADYVEVEGCLLANFYSGGALSAMDTREIRVSSSELTGYGGGDGLLAARSDIIHVEDTYMEGGTGYNGGGCQLGCSNLAAGGPGGDGANFIDCRSVFLCNSTFVPGAGGYGALGSSTSFGCAPCGVGPTGPPGNDLNVENSTVAFCKVSGAPKLGPGSQIHPINCDALQSIVAWDSPNIDGDWNADMTIDVADLVVAN